MPDLISGKFLLLATAIAVAGGAVIYAGVEYEDWTLLVAGIAVVAGALVALGILLRGKFAAGAAPKAAGRSVRQKLKHFWEPMPEGVAPGATAEQVAAAEQKLGVRLPPEYVGVLQTQDGGEPRYSLWAAAQPTPPDHGCDLYRIDSLHGTQNLVDVTEDLVESESLPERVVCICGYGDDDWQLGLDYRNAPDARPAVVAFDEQGECHRLAESFAEFVGGLTRSLPAFVYAPQGALGKAVDALLMDLSQALGVEWRERPGEVGVYTAEHASWQSIPGGNASFDLRVNAVEGPGDKSMARFPESWSYRVLYCAIHPRHRADLERCLRGSGRQWILVNQPVEWLVAARFYG